MSNLRASLAQPDQPKADPRTADRYVARLMGRAGWMPSEPLAQHIRRELLDFRAEGVAQERLYVASLKNEIERLTRERDALLAAINAALPFCLHESMRILQAALDAAMKEQK